ncbi:hypothetical protein SOVF_170930 [Spinacia oleracea]|nr:hypothetical protein SOVF_170930 [Spinacia oleracea]
MTGKGRTMEVIMMPFHHQGHLTPMLQFAKRFAWKGAGSIRITLATTLSTAQNMTNSKNNNNNNDYDFLTVESIYDDTDDSQLKFMGRMGKFKSEASLQLGRLITTKSIDNNKCMLVYDAYLPWALDVGKDHNIQAAAFFVQACAYMASFYPMFLEEFGSDDQHPVVAAAKAESVPSLSVELPSREEMERYAPKCAQSPSSDDKPNTVKKSLHPVYRMVVSSITTLHLADFVLINSFDHLEHQLDVLAHEAVGCFITHCGWNSIIEATNFGVPMLGMPQFMDQFLDAHFMEKVWGVGIRAKADEKNFVTCDEIKCGVNEIMYGDKANMIKENAAKWKDLAKEAVGEGGSSDKNIDEIINWLASS